MRTLDLRGRTLDVRDLRAELPAGGGRRRAGRRADPSRRRRRPAPRRGRAARPRRAVRGRASRAPAGAGDGARRGAGRRSTRPCARPSRSRSAAPAPCTPPSAAPTPRVEVVPGGTVTERWVPVGRVGPVRAGRARGVPVQRGDERRARAGGRRRRRWSWRPRRRRTSAACRTPRSSRRARCSASRRSTPSAAPRPWRCSPTARARATGRTRARWSAVRSTSSPVPATSGSPPRSGWCSGVVGIDSEAGVTEIAVLADDTADPAHVAADLISQAEHDPDAASVLVTPSTGLADAVAEALVGQVAATKHTERVAGRAVRPAVGGRPGRRPRGRARRVRRLRRRAPGDPDPRRARASPRGCATPAPSSSARTRRSRSATTAPGRTTCCPPAGAPAHSSGLSVQTFLRGVHVIEYDPRGARRRRRPRRRAGRRRGPARARCRGQSPLLRRRLTGPTAQQPDAPAGAPGTLPRLVW